MVGEVTEIVSESENDCHTHSQNMCVCTLQTLEAKIYQKQTQNNRTTCSIDRIRSITIDLK